MVSPSKVQRLSIRQLSAKDATPAENSILRNEAASTTVCAIDPLDLPLQSILPEELQQLVLSLLLTPPSTLAKGQQTTLCDKQRPHTELRSNHHTLSLVSKGWKRAVGDFVNRVPPATADSTLVSTMTGTSSPRQVATTLTVVTPRELAQLKEAASRLDLSSSSSNPSIPMTFVRLLQTHYPRTIFRDVFGNVHDHLSSILLDCIIPLLDSKCRGASSSTSSTCDSMHTFTKLVEDEYKRFLVVKCVEILTARKSVVVEHELEHDPTTSTRCHPLVELFWQAHILTTNKYYADCDSLIHDTIPFHRTSSTTYEHTPVVAPSRRDRIFAFEKHFLKRNYYCDCSMPGTMARRHPDRPVMHESVYLRLLDFFCPTNSLQQIAEEMERLQSCSTECECWNSFCCSYCCSLQHSNGDDEYEA